MKRNPQNQEEPRENGRRRSLVLGVVAVAALLFVLSAGTAAAQSTFDDCTILTQSDSHELTQDIETTSSGCLTVVANDTVIEGNGYRINGSGASGSAGIILQPFFGAIPENITIRNVTVSNFETAVEATRADDVTFSNVTTFATNTSVSVENSTNVTVENATISDTDEGIRANASANVSVRNSTVTSTILFTPIPDPFPTFSAGDPLSTTSHNKPNETGILFTDTENGEVLNNEVLNFNGTGVVINSSPREQTTLIDLSSDSSTSNEVVGNEINNNGEGVRVVGSTSNTVEDNEIIFNDGEGVSILPGTEEGSGPIGTLSFHASSSGNVVRDNNATDNAGAAVSLRVPNEIDVAGSVTDNEVLNNTLNENEHGVNVTAAEENEISNNTVRNNTNHGVWLGFGANSNNVTDNVMINNTESGVYVGGASPGGATTQNSDNRVVNNTVRGSEYGIWIGSSLDTLSRENLVEDNREGIEVFGDSLNSAFVNDTSRNNTEFDFRVTDGSANTTATNLGIGESTAPDTTLSFGARNVTLRSVDAPAQNPSLENISRFFNATENGPGAFLNVSLGYEDGDVSGVNESTLRIARNDGSGWVNLSASSVDTAANAVSANITSFSEYGAYGESEGGSEPTAAFDYTPSSPNASEDVTFDASSSGGSISEYRWDFDGDGGIDTTSSNPTAVHAYPEPGEYSPILQVTDGSATDTVSQTVTVSQDGGSNSDSNNPFFSGGGPLSKSDAANVLFEWNTNNGVVNGRNIPKGDMADFLFDWNLAG